MADTKKMMMEWLGTDGAPMNTKGSQVIAETTGETFDAHSADASKHLTSAEKNLVSKAGAAGGVAVLDATGHLPSGVFDSTKLPVEHTVADIDARDALVDMPDGYKVFVEDASADTSVASGWAIYRHRAAQGEVPAGWIKLAEAESLDVIHAWANLQDKPASAVSDIDDAVALKHSHANASSLEKLTVDADGLKVDGVGVGGIAILSSPADSPVYSGKLRLVVTEYTPPVV